MTASNRKNVPFLELPGWKKVPIDDLGGQNLLPINNCWPSTKNEHPHFLKFFPCSIIREVIHPCQNSSNPFLTRFWPHIKEIQPKGWKLPLKMIKNGTWNLIFSWVEKMFWYYRLLLHGIENNILWQHIPIFSVVWSLVQFSGENRSSAAFL